MKHLATGTLLFLSPLFCYADNTPEAAVNTVWLMTAAGLVFFMQAGFALLESGMSRAKNAVNVMMKNYLDVCLGSLIFWLVGYGLMFGNNVSGFFGSDHFFMSDIAPWDAGFILFQTMFAATAATICSGAMAERAQFRGYLIASGFITGLIYPLVGSWVWGGVHGGQGWLAQMGFIDFAGSTVVHSVGAWCALAGIIVLGARSGRFSEHGDVREIPGHNLSMVALGGFILWLGWFGFNGGSTLKADVSIGPILLNTHLSACAGAVVVMLWRVLQNKAILLTETVNGSIAGLVAITAGCASMDPAFAILTGFIGGLLVIAGTAFLNALRLDDVVGAIPVHGFAGVWGTLAAGMFFSGDLFNSQRLVVQSIGVFSIFMVVFPVSLLLYWLTARMSGLRADTQHEQRGLDVTEHAERGYPEFQAAALFDKRNAA